MFSFFDNVVSFFTDLFDLLKKLEGTPWEPLIPLAVVLVLGYALIRWGILPIWNGIRRFLQWREKNRFSLHESLNFMPRDDITYAIDHYIPTRYSDRDPARNPEPVPEEMGEDLDRQPLLLDHFLKYEFDVRHGEQYYLILTDCGMGKTTFLINLFYALSKRKKQPCAFVSLSCSDCLEQIKRIPAPERTILLLDALDESDAAMRSFGAFMEELGQAVQHFSRVLVTSRTNFFTKAEEERLFQGNRTVSATRKIIQAKKYYITPFTDGDIQKYLHQRYKKRDKYQKAWKLVRENRHLSVRPLLLHYLDDMIQEEVRCAHSFELYEYLFRKWIARETSGTAAEQQALYDECLKLAKAMYQQWMKDGRVGIYPDEIDEAQDIPGLSKIRFQGHAILNRTAEGMYKFAHRSFWEYLLAQLALTDLPFSDELFIRNFDQAEAFLKEMIKARQDHGPAALLGTANYYLKYWRPEEAERILVKLLETDGTPLTEEQELFGWIHLIRAYRYLWKEASAERILLTLLKRMDETELTPALLPHFTQFGVELAVYSHYRDLSLGRAYLRRVIDFCQTQPPYGYDLFVCLECCCYCALNPAERERIRAEMEEQMLRRFGEQRDQYAETLFCLANLWGTPSDDLKGLETQRYLLRSYEQFFDSPASIQRRCDLACSLAACLGKTQELSSEAFNDEAVEECLGRAYDTVCDIYDEITDFDEENICRSYMARIQYYGYYYRKELQFRSEELKEVHSSLLGFRRNAHLEDELQIWYCRILHMGGKLTSEAFPEREASLKEALSWAQLIRCRSDEIDALWALFVLYDGTDGTDADGQAELKRAYDLACQDADYKETISYCQLLQVMLDFYAGDLDRESIYLELRGLVPTLYGADVRRARICRCLRKYASKTGKAEAADYAVECLRCEFKSFTLKETYDACRQFADEARFLAALESVLREQQEVTDEEESAIDSFLKDRQPDLREKVQQRVLRVKQEKEAQRIMSRRGRHHPAVPVGGTVGR